jgi:DNA-binding FrmR family transcriptional regulator
MSKIIDSVSQAVNQAAGELIDNNVTKKLSDAAKEVVGTSFAIVEDVLKIVRDATATDATGKPKPPSP